MNRRNIAAEIKLRRLQWVKHTISQQLSVSKAIIMSTADGQRERGLELRWIDGVEQDAKASVLLIGRSN